MVLFYRPNMAVGTVPWDCLLGLGCPNPRVALLLELGQRLELVLVPFLGPSSSWDCVALSQLGFRLLMTVPTWIGNLRVCPNSLWDFLALSQLTLELPLCWDCLGAPQSP